MRFTTTTNTAFPQHDNVSDDSIEEDICVEKEEIVPKKPAQKTSYKKKSSPRNSTDKP
jgi:hypothetical protein